MPNVDAAQSPVIIQSTSPKKKSLINPNLIFSGSTVTPPTLTRGSFVQRASLDLKRKSIRPDPLDVGLQSFDFIPHCIEPEKTIKLGRWPEFEDFTALIPSANDFIRRNPQLAIKTCETVQLNVDKDCLKTPEQTDYLQFAESVRPFVKAMRMWTTTIDDKKSGEPEQISYVNFLPPPPKLEGVCPTDYAYQSATELASAINEFLDVNPVKGRLLNVESLQIRGQDDPYHIDMNLTAWSPQPVKSVPRQRFVNCFRIWYVVGPPAHETVGIVDVFPGTTAGEAHLRIEREKDKKHSILVDTMRRSKRRKSSVIEKHIEKEKKIKAKRDVVKDKSSRFPKVETFDIVMAKLNGKLGELPRNSKVLSVNQLSARSVFVDGVHSHDAYKITYRDDYFYKYYIKFLRLVHIHSPGMSTPTLITPKLFAPHATKRPGCCRRLAKYEKLSHNGDRLDDWVFQTKSNVVSVETVAYKTTSGTELREGFDVMNTWNIFSKKYHEEEVDGSKWTQYVICYRLYVLGQGEDPDTFRWKKTWPHYRVPHGFYESKCYCRCC